MVPTRRKQEEERRRKKVKLAMLPEIPVDISMRFAKFHKLNVPIDADKFLDIFPPPLEGSPARLLDGQDFQWVPHKQVITTCLAGLIRDGPGKRTTTPLPFWDHRNGIRESCVRPILHHFSAILHIHTICSRRIVLTAVLRFEHGLS